MLRAGQLTADSGVWGPGLAAWTRAGDVPQLQGALAPQQPQSPPQVAPAGAAPSNDDRMDAVFVALVKDSWKRFRKRETSACVDEVLVGAVIASTVEYGFSLIDIESTGADHYLRFEEISSGRRIIFRLSHQAEALVTAQVLGHEASVTIGYGERVRDFNTVWRALKQEMKGGYVAKADPGIMSVDADMSSQYVYVEVGLLWDINDYLAPDDPYKVNYPKLTEAIGATLHALRKYLHGRIGSQLLG
jgi:hypothetical protein